MEKVAIGFSSLEFPHLVEARYRSVRHGWRTRAITPLLLSYSKSENEEDVLDVDVICK